MYRSTSEPPNRRPVADIELPTTLARPPAPSDPDHIFRGALDAIFPELADIPLPFIHQQLCQCLGRMIRGINTLPLPKTVSRRHLPRVLTVPFPRNVGEGIIQPLYPTHILAVSLASSEAEPDELLTLIPVHGIIFTAHCATPVLLPSNLSPTVPATDGQPYDGANGGTSAESHPDLDDSDTDPHTLALPVCSLTLPSIHALVTLRTYMYYPHASTLLQALFSPLPSPLPLADADVLPALASPATKLRLATHLLSAHAHAGAATGGVVAPLLQYVARVRDVWHAAWAVGMYRPELWDTINLAWELVIYALNLAMDSHAQEPMHPWDHLRDRGY